MPLLFLYVDVLTLHHLPFERELKIRYNYMQVMHSKNICEPQRYPAIEQQSKRRITTNISCFDVFGLTTANKSRNPSFEIF